MAASLDLKSKEEKDAELDKRIEALRRKNQALIRRYQEIEEDRRKAEQEGIAVTGARRPRSAEGEAPERRRRELGSPTLTVQVLLSPEEKRVVSSERNPPSLAKASRSSARSRGSVRGAPYQSSPSPRAEGPPEQHAWEGADPDGLGASRRGHGGRGRRPRGRGGPGGDAGPDRRSKEWEERRRQNIEKMNEEMEKIAEYERSRRDGLQEKNPVRNFLDDPRRSGPFAESDRREGSRRHVRNWGGPDFDKVKTGMEQGKEWPPAARGGGRRRGTALDMTLSMTGRERAEYIRWKQEREQIDQERLARHRQPTGEWRREWDAEKMDATCKEAARSGASAASKQDDSRRPPRLPTFAEFLPEQRPERRRRSRGRERTRGAPSKPYSMHDNRWEKEEPDSSRAATVPAEDKAEGAPARQMAAPTLPCTAPEDEGEEEEEDQWEDVSEGEEEEEEVEGSGSQGSLVEEESGLPSASQDEEPSQPGQGAQLSLAMPAPQAETPSTEGKPLTPFSPAEGYRPVSDWGEEMELSSPWADATKSTPAMHRERPPASAGLCPPGPLAEQAPLQAEVAATAEFRAPETEKPLALELQAGAVREPGEPRIAVEPAPAEIVDLPQEPPEA
ncbi:coiled-coil domain-containing protein 9 isoform X1 [Tiliqua scincoides]|uniref:coiled-coil domain-containing protein 9 isoform X1 n=1 Tax=Tiliqua scincoides TaxID=71010 RepID=UPI003462BC29